MKQTLLLIPVNYVLILWLVGSLIALVFLIRKHGFGNDVFSFVAFSGIGAAVIYFGAEHFQTALVNEADPLGPKNVGLPIRGYGFFLLLATVSGVGLAAWRAKRLGQSPDDIFALAFWMFVLGISGARIFYLFQYWNDFEIKGVVSFLRALVAADKGGLVVYGGLIGGLIALLGFTRYKKLPLFEIADIIAPSMILGLSLGRLGCLMNGCCFGGACQIEEVAIQFPPGSPPYMRQIETGEMFGVKATLVQKPEEAVDEEEVDEASEEKETQPVLPTYLAEQIEPGSIADKVGLKEGDEFTIYYGEYAFQLMDVGHKNAKGNIWIQIGDESKMVPVSALPSNSLKIHPTQVYSSINAALIFLFLWFFFPFRQRSGQVFAVLLMLYPISRTILEFIRTDEQGLWGTPFTISQWVSLFIFTLGLGLYVCVMLAKDEDPSSAKMVATSA